MAPKKPPKPKAHKARKRQRHNNDPPVIPAATHQNLAPPAPTSTSPFLRIPRELRDQIYHEIWRHKVPFIISYERVDFQFEMSYDNAPRPINYRARPRCTGYFYIDNPSNGKTRPPWILANRQILQEAIAQFHRKLTCAYAGLVKYETFVNPSLRVEAHLPCFVVPSTAHRRRFLLQPWNAYTLELSKIELRMDIQLAGRAHGINMWALDSDLLKWLTSSILSPAQTKRMTLKICAYTCNVDANALISIELNKLKHLDLPSVYEIEIIIDFHDRCNTTTIRFIESRLRQELLEVGMALVGGAGASSSGASELLDHKHGQSFRFKEPPGQCVKWNLKFTRG